MECAVVPTDLPPCKKTIYIPAPMMLDLATRLDLISGL